MQIMRKWVKQLGIGLLTIIPICAFACTRVLMADGQHHVIVGRTMDWFQNMATALIAYPEGINRNGMAEANPITWTAKYGSLVAAVEGGFTSDGINEKGLAAHLLWLSETDYGVRDNNKPGLSVILWAQYYLDNFASVKEAVEYTETTPLQILPFYDPISKIESKVHLVLDDKTGDSAIFEYINGKVKIYHDSSYTVAANSPTYDLQLKNLSNYQGLGGSNALPGTSNSSDRFVRATYYSQHTSAMLTTHDQLTVLKSIMQNTSEPFEGASSQNARPTPTIWRVYVDLTQGIYYFDDLNRFNTIWVALNKFSFSPGSPIKILDLSKHLNMAGDVSTKFQNFSAH